MDFNLSKQQKEIQGEILAFSRAHLNGGLVERDKNQVFDRSLWQKLGEQKIPGLCIPEVYGGKGFDALTTVLALEALGEGCEDGGLCFAVAAHLLACCVPIWKYGNEDQKHTLLPKLCDGTWIAANAMTEGHSGSDAFNLKTEAVQNGGNYLLNGVKTFVSNAPVADVLVTYASTNQSKGFFGGITGFLLQKEKHVYTVSEAIEKMGVRTCQMGEVTFGNLEVPVDSVLGKNGGGGMIFNTSMEWERICLGAIHLGAMNRMMIKAIEFANKRSAGGKSLGSYQAVSHKLAELKVRLESAKWMCYRSAWKLDQNQKVGLEASSTKLLVSELFKDFSQQIFQIFAGQAFRENHEAERLLRDAMAGTIYSGTSEVQKNIIVKQIGL